MCLCHMLLVLTPSNNHSIAPSSWEGLQSRLGGLTGLQRWATIYIKGSRDAMNKFTYQMKEMKVATSSHKCAASKSVGRDQKRHMHAFKKIQINADGEEA